MPLQHLTESVPNWITAPPDTPEPVLSYQCMLSRNLAGFVFPNQCPDEERRAVELRIQTALSKVGEVPPGAYHPVAEMDMTALRFLAERRLAPVEFLGAPGTRGIHIADDQSLAILVNMNDHIVIRGLSGGGRLEELWTVVDNLDNALGNALEYAYHDRLGYLTSSLRLLGTGLKVAVLLHLPAIAMSGEETRYARLMNSRGLTLRGVALGEPVPGHNVHPTLPSASRLAADIEPTPQQSLYMDTLGALQTEPESTVGNLFLLTNQDTLGVSEEECFLGIDQAVSTLVQEEESVRARLLSEQRTPLMDRIGRALGIAQSARLLGMGETLMLASMIRLAVSLGLVTGCNCNALNRALLECQQAHLQYMRGLPPDPRALAGERARMFRALFAGTEMN